MQSAGSEPGNEAIRAVVAILSSAFTALLLWKIRSVLEAMLRVAGGGGGGGGGVFPDGGNYWTV